MQSGPHEGHIGADRRPRSDARLVWRRISGIATRQRGLITVAQLADCGLTATQRKRALRRSHLHHHRRGVYSVGHRHLCAEARLLGATLAAGPGAVLAGGPSLQFWDLLKLDRPLEVLAPHHRRGARDLRIRRRPFDPRRDVRHRRGVPVLEPLAALADVARTLTDDQVQHVVDELDVRRLLHPRAVERLLRLTADRPGSKAVRRALGNRDPSKGRPRSRLERAYARFARRHGLPPARRGGLVDIGDGRGGLELREMDVFYAAAKLIVELDGCAVHGTARAKARDARRDRRLLAAGVKTVRVTRSDLDDHEAELAEDLQGLLGV